MKIEKIYFDEDTFIWKTKLNLKQLKNNFLHRCDYLIDVYANVETNDAYPYKYNVKIPYNVKKDWQTSISKEIVTFNDMDKIVQCGIDACDSIYINEIGNWNVINSISWINRVRSKTPIQKNFNADDRNERFHTHTEISKRANHFNPNYTWVYYIQMPDNIQPNSDDGVIYFKSKTGVEYSILPEEDDLIIMSGDMPHLPMNAPKSSIDRIVLAGNVGFEYIKQTKSLF